jgi:hypothetical protein
MGRYLVLGPADSTCEAHPARRRGYWSSSRLSAISAMPITIP